MMTAVFPEFAGPKYFFRATSHERGCKAVQGYAEVEQRLVEPVRNLECRCHRMPSRKLKKQEYQPMQCRRDGPRARYDVVG
jgi:hypothetical protein